MTIQEFIDYAEFRLEEARGQHFMKVTDILNDIQRKMASLPEVHLFRSIDSACVLVNSMLSDLSIEECAEHARRSINAYKADSVL